MKRLPESWMDMVLLIDREFLTSVFKICKPEYLQFFSILKSEEIRKNS